MNTNKIALFGLGKLGLPLVSIFSQSIKVKAFDVDKNKIDCLKNGHTPFYEPNLQEFLKKGKNNLVFEEVDEFDIEEVDIVVILVNTPSDQNGGFSNCYINDVIENIAPKLKTSSKKDFLFILSSTVMPDSHKEIIKKIELLSERKLNNGFGFSYVPDLVALGSVIKDFQNPDVLILGSSNEGYANTTEKLYKNILKNEAPIIKMSLIESEITKISLNAYITMKISFANFIGNVADKFNCNPFNITKALGHDKRISPYYIKSGLAFGGTCFPRDTWAFINMCDKIGLNAEHIKATENINKQQNILLFNKIASYKNKKIGIIGIAFKPDTTVTTESPSIYIIEKLKAEKYNVEAFDKLITPQIDLLDFVSRNEVIVLMHNDKKLIENINFSDKIVINPWNIKL